MDCPLMIHGMPTVRPCNMIIHCDIRVYQWKSSHDQHSIHRLAAVGGKQVSFFTFAVFALDVFALDVFAPTVFAPYVRASTSSMFFPCVFARLRFCSTLSPNHFCSCAFASLCVRSRNTIQYNAMPHETKTQRATRQEGAHIQMMDQHITFE